MYVAVHEFEEVEFGAGFKADTAPAAFYGFFAAAVAYYA